MADDTTAKEWGPVIRQALRALGVGPALEATVGRPAQLADQEAAAGSAPAPAQPGVQPSQLTPEQQSDLYALGTGRMRLQEFVAKHGFVPRQGQ